MVSTLLFTFDFVTLRHLLAPSQHVNTYHSLLDRQQGNKTPYPFSNKANNPPHNISIHPKQTKPKPRE
jgi:hypothetical protein